LNEELYAVIMAGGVGSRLWPRSRVANPKQFLDLLGARTMLQETVDRIEPLIPLERVLVVVSEQHAQTVLDQVPGLPEENVIVEPGPRGTAPCIGLAATCLKIKDPAAIMAVCPADHHIADPAGFRRAIGAAVEVAEQDYLVTLGITPDHAHTGYGYIQRGQRLAQADGLPSYKVQRFAEKPNLAKAQQFYASGEYYWNGGIFVWSVAKILNEIENLLPELHSGLQSIAQAWNSPQQAEALAAAWGQVPRTTIDYGIMEKAARVAVVPVDIGWDDVGNWSTLSGFLETDEKGNSTRGKGRHLLVDTTDTYVYATQDRLVATIGLEDFVVVDTPDALLICPKDQAQDVREIVDRLKARGQKEYL